MDFGLKRMDGWMDRGVNNLHTWGNWTFRWFKLFHTTVRSGARRNYELWKAAVPFVPNCIAIFFSVVQIKVLNTNAQIRGRYHKPLSRTQAW